jgi:dipeptidyl aminopeptidase/acylaminoacyl peptidase
MSQSTLRSCCCLLALAASALGARETHPFDVHDLLAMQRLSSPAVSPDGGTVAFVVRTTDLEADRGRTDLWAVGVDGERLRQLTTHEAADAEPAWSPDGSRLYFLSSRSGSMQVWELPTAGGEPRQVTDLPLDVANLLVSPDGSRLAFTLEVFVDCESLQCTADRLAEREARKASGQAYDRLFVRHWDTWKDGRRSHPFTMPLGGEGAEPVDLARGLDADVPSKPFGGSEEIAWSRDSRHLVFAARVAGNGEPWSTDFDLWSAPADGSAPPRNLTEANPAWDTHPVFSPDGRTLAYLAMERAGYESDRFRLMLRSWPDGEPREVARDWDRSAGDLQFSSDGSTLLVTAGNVGKTSLFAIDAKSGAVRELVPGGTRPRPGSRASSWSSCTTTCVTPPSCTPCRSQEGAPRRSPGSTTSAWRRSRPGSTSSSRSRLERRDGATATWSSPPASRRRRSTRWLS